MRAIYSSISFCRHLKYMSLGRQFRKLHYSFVKQTEYKTYLQCVSYDDSRLQNYLRELKIQHSNALYDNTLYDHKSLNGIISLIKDVDAVNSDMNELTALISELKEKNDAMLSIAETEMEDLKEKLSSLKVAVLYDLIPNQIIDDKDIIMELAPGVGGQEAMLFTKDMFDMYCNYAHWKGWSCEIVKYDETGMGGVRTAHIAISGKNAYKILKYECGVHRVQRIPKTEKAGRIHTSTMTVAVLPQPSEIDITISPKDIELEFKRSGGAGGQHVNTTDSCVRIYHKPTGIMVESQVERCQHKNRELAMKSLRTKLYNMQLESIMKEEILNRKLQVGNAGRSEKIRTYNFVQDRITDHRAQLSLYGVDSFFRGEELLSKLLDRLEEWNSIHTLMHLLEKYEAT